MGSLNKIGITTNSVHMKAVPSPPVSEKQNLLKYGLSLASLQISCDLWP